MSNIQARLNSLVGKDLHSIAKSGILGICHPVSVMVSKDDSDQHGKHLDTAFNLVSIVSAHPEVKSYVVFDAGTFLDEFVLRVRAPKEEMQ